jgi:Flp pilus assembly pilin Flp
MLDLVNLLRGEVTNPLGGDKRGVVYVEYALLIALIALVVAGAATALGSNISFFFSELASYIASLPGPPSP